MSLAKKAISGAIWMSGISYIGFAINFGIQLMLVRLLVPEDFGLFALGLSIANMLFIFFSFSFSMGVIQIQEAEDLLDTAFYLSIISGAVILLIGGIISLILIRHYPLQSVLAFFTLCTLQILQGCSSIYSASMEKEVQFKKVAIVRGMATNFSGIIAVVMAYAGLGIWSLLGREILSSALMFIGMTLTSSYSFGRRFNRQTAKKLIDFAFKRLFIRGLESAYFNGPIFLMGNFTTPKELGFFTQAVYLAGLPNTFLSPIQQNVAFSVYSKISEQKEKLQQAFDIIIFLSVFFLMPVSIVVYLFPGQILMMLFGEKWIQSSTALQFLSPYVTFYSLTMCVVILLYSLRIGDIIKIYSVQLAVFVAIFIVGMSGDIIKLSSIAYSASILTGFFAGAYFLRGSGIEIALSRQILKPLGACLIIVVSWNMLLAPNIAFYSFSKVLTLLMILFAFVVSALIVFFAGNERNRYFLKYAVSYLRGR